MLLDKGVLSCNLVWARLYFLATFVEERSNFGNSCLGTSAIFVQKGQVFGKFV